MPGRLEVVAATIFAPDQRVLIARRPADVHQGGLWEFPGGKVEAGETPEQALSRELWEELAIRPMRCRRLLRVPYRYPDRHVLLDVWRVDGYRGTPQGRQGQPLRWVAPEELPSYRFPAANRPIVAAVRLPSRYLITPDGSDADALLAGLEKAVAGGIRLVQLRLPSMTKRAYAELAQQAIAVCHAQGAKVLLNAEPELALQLNADGAHLSAWRLRQLSARPLPQDFYCAASCHNAAELQRAQALGLDFAVLSPVKPTASHPGAPALGWAAFAGLVWDAPLPVYALGGLSSAELPQAYAARAQGIAAIRGLWSS